MNPALSELYQGIVLEHSASPRNSGPLPDATHEARADNPLCGDRVALRLRLDGGHIAAARFEGQGCAISIASASLLTGLVEGATPAQALALRAELRRLLGPEAEHAAADRSLLADLVALEGTRQFPSRVPCATLAWDALARALDGAT